MNRSKRYVVTLRGRELGVEVAPLGRGRVSVKIEGSPEPPLEVTLSGDASDPIALIGHHVLELWPSGNQVAVRAEHQSVRVESREKKNVARSATNGTRSGLVRAPMPGRVVKVLVEPGATVARGAGVVVVEAMKMENELLAQVAGVVERVFVGAGDRVERGAPLVEIR